MVHPGSDSEKLHAPPSWKALAQRAAEAASRLPPLPCFEQVRNRAREPLFWELGYTFWNRQLLDGLAARCRSLGPLRWVELAAGTGRLAAELARRAVPVAATDDYSQSANRVRGGQRAVRYGAWVEGLTARDAVHLIRPEAVLCAWPPLGTCLVPGLLTGAMAGGELLRAVVCIGEPGGATEAPVEGEIPEGWLLERWPECEPFLIGFNDPPAGPASRTNSRLLVYRRS
jgi:hypothetical protein